MSLSIYFLILSCFVLTVSSLVLKSNAIFRSGTRTSSSSSLLRSIPLELEGQLDPSKSWEVKFILHGKEKVVQVPEDVSFLQMGEKLFDSVPSSCRNGVCTTCAGKVQTGKENVLQAVHALGQPQLDAGYILTCQSFAKGPGIVVTLDQYDEVYESQYGQFEKSYGELKYTNGNEPVQEEKKKKGLFGF